MKLSHIFLYVLLLPSLIFGQKITASSDEKRSNEADTYQKVSYQLRPNFEMQEIVDFLYQQFPFLDRNITKLVLSNDKTSKGGRHLTFDLYYSREEEWGETKCFPVYEMGVKVNLNRENKITSILNQVEKYKNMKTFFSFPTDEFRKKYGIQAYYENKYKAYTSTVKRIWYVENTVVHPAYQIITYSHQYPFSMEIITNNQGLIVLKEEDRAVYHKQHKAAFVGDTTGKGYVFIPDPRTSSHQNYGVIVSDNNDQHLPVFDDYTYDIILKQIKYDTANHIFKLEGPYVKIEDIDPNTIAPATTTDGNFYYTRDASGFEDVMAYYHIDSMQRYIQVLGFNNMYNSPLRVDPHGWGNSDNSHFIAAGANSYLGFGEGGVDDAEDLDVLVHEYGHALSYSVAANTNTGTERKGLDEGFGDYLAASRSYDMDTFFWSQTYTWDGHNQYWGGRNAASTVVYPPTVNLYGNWIYAYGDIWASTLMRIRFATSDTLGDILALEEMYSNYSNMTLKDAAQLYLDADSSLYGGAHSNIIRQKFCEVNLMTGNDCIITSVSTTLDKTIGEIFPNPAQHQLQCMLPPSNQPYNLKIFDIQGKLQQQNTVENAQKISIQLASGLYYVQLCQGEKILGMKKLVVE